jgi:hypothetical protein
VATSPTVDRRADVGLRTSDLTGCTAGRGFVYVALYRCLRRSLHSLPTTSLRLPFNDPFRQESPSAGAAPSNEPFVSPVPARGIGIA